MEIDDSLLALFHAQITSTADEFHLQIPESELEIGELSESETYRVAILPSGESGGPSDGSFKERQPTEEEMSVDHDPTPPVSEGDRRDVHIKSKGDEGDGVAFIDTGYAVFVSGAQIGENLTVEIETVHDRFAFAEPINGQMAEEVRT
ncbi:TRAM domain-containing protein [Haloarcula sp. Atlit-7R]|uniref:TRAM domain-containing protein n=1 Tax=Haloarcula sp. Atlit-7R TaxID=2282125 RepID=UPI000EF15F34|nr:TRAM domain-containing protein [Haloarcula sp. Atlit-7R]RLM94273.1 TRAM domain-containing protein [Haloarcula sp. Atlit-7R]